MQRRPGNSIAVAAAGVAAAIAVAACLVPLRSTLGGTNVALVLVVVVVAAAIAGGRIAGATTSLAASLSFNFWFVTPYLTLRIDEGRDMVAVALILVIGLVVGQLTVTTARRNVAHASELRAMRGLERVIEVSSDAGRPEAVWAAIREELVTTLHVRDADLVADGTLTDTIPVIERDGRIDRTVHHHHTGSGFALPEEGVQIIVEADGRRYGAIVITPDPMTPVSREQRRALVAMADQLALASRRVSGSDAGAPRPRSTGHA